MDAKQDGFSTPYMTGGDFTTIRFTLSNCCPQIYHINTSKPMYFYRYKHHLYLLSGLASKFHVFERLNMVNLTGVKCSPPPVIYGRLNPPNKLPKSGRKFDPKSWNPL